MHGRLENQKKCESVWILASKNIALKSIFAAFRRVTPPPPLFLLIFQKLVSIATKNAIFFNCYRIKFVYHKIASRRGAPQASYDRRRHRNNLQTRPAQAFRKKKVNISRGQRSVDAIKPV